MFVSLEIAHGPNGERIPAALNADEDVTEHEARVPTSSFTGRSKATTGDW